jgi:serine-type D-Ala-D-Ala carboxypeptidase (penicillin-binding protein 5/6)
VSMTATLLGGTVLTGAAAVAAPLTAPSDVKPPQPRPPARMSTVGGERLGLPGTQVVAAAGVPAVPKGISARSWIVADAETGEVLAARNAHWRLAPASTLKMLFADTVLPKIPNRTVHRVAPAELRGMGEGSSLVGIKENLSYTVRDLWLGVFLRSGNDAVHVLSAMNGGVPKTVADMNAQAHELQAADTHVVTPDGYDEPGQVSSAYDLTLFARDGLQNADFRTYCSTVSAQFPGEWTKKKDKQGKLTAVRESFAIQNTNRLLSGDYDLARYQGIAGVKNGNTTDAGATFTGVAQRGDRTLLVTVMHPASRHDQVYREAAALLDWGFAAAPAAEPVGTLVPPLSKVPHTAAPSAPAPGTPVTPGGPRAQAAVTSGASSSGGLWTAAGITAGTGALLAAVVIVVRRRRPLPFETDPLAGPGAAAGTRAGTRAGGGGGAGAAGSTGGRRRRARRGR